MSSLGVLLVCIQACLVQNAFCQCLTGPGIGYGPGFAGPGIIGPYGAGIAPGYGYGIPGPGIATYGGSGSGDVAVFGELPVTGTTVVTGQVPIIGTVQFGGPVPAAGGVTISGFCNCGCNSGYVF